MQAEILREIIDELNACPIDGAARQAALDAICRVVRRYRLPSFERDEQVAFAQELLALKVPREVIAGRLITTFDIGKTTAYERISKALQLSGKIPLFRTENGNNTHNEESFLSGKDLE